MSEDLKKVLNNNIAEVQSIQIKSNFFKSSNDNNESRKKVLSENSDDFFNLNASGDEQKNSNENDEVNNLHNAMSELTTIMKNTNNQTVMRPILGCTSINESSDEDKPLDKADASHIQHIIRTNLVQTDRNDVEVLQQDPNDPLYSVTEFRQLKLKSDLLRGIFQMDFRKPSSIQEKALPMLIDPTPKNLIAQSQSGTGKTATFLLTMFSKVDSSLPYCQCLCMAPTRELALQIAEVAQRMSKFMQNIKISCAIKGHIPQPYYATLNENIVTSQIVIGTPGTLKHWIVDGSSFYINPRQLKVFVLDEADVLIENPEFLNISRRIKSKVKNDCQILLFSATYDENVMEFAREFVPRANEIRVKTQRLTLKNIHQFYIPISNFDNKYQTLIEIFGMKSMGQCIIFCESRRNAAEMQLLLERDGHLSSLLSGELDVAQREEQLKHFRDAKSRILIATNLCSRGIDIPQVNLIINWDMPRTIDGRPDCETYLHRIGRSGRFGKSGLSINFIASEKDRVIQDKIIQHYQTTIEEMKDLNIISQM